MKRFVVCSDNHRNRQAIDYIKEHYSDYDYLIHCGDSEMKPEELEGFIYVRGNHDDFMDDSVPYQIILEVEGHRIYICHGHMDFMRYFKYQSMVDHAKEKNCDIILFGHVHTYQDLVMDGIRLLNPGSMYHNRDATHPSYMLLEIDGENIKAEKVEYIQNKNAKKGWLEAFLDRISGRD